MDLEHLKKEKNYFNLFIKLRDCFNGIDMNFCIKVKKNKEENLKLCVKIKANSIGSLDEEKDIIATLKNDITFDYFSGLI